jgi:hypothetical protein
MTNAIKVVLQMQSGFLQLESTIVTFGIFAHVIFPVPLYFFFRSAELLVLSINVINRIDNCYNLLN